MLGNCNFKVSSLMIIGYCAAMSPRRRTPLYPNCSNPSIILVLHKAQRTKLLGYDLTDYQWTLSDHEIASCSPVSFLERYQFSFMRIWKERDRTFRETTYYSPDLEEITYLTCPIDVTQNNGTWSKSNDSNVRDIGVPCPYNNIRPIQFAYTFCDNGYLSSVTQIISQVSTNSHMCPVCRLPKLPI